MFKVRYLVVGGLAFTFHALPRFTKDIDLWLESDGENVGRANEALNRFGSPDLLDPNKPEEIVQIGTAPNRIDILRTIEGPAFDDAWGRRVTSSYGRASVNWIALDDLIAIKERIDHPRHQEDVRILKLVRERQRGQR